jgi:hypothetical protein
LSGDIVGHQGGELRLLLLLLLLSLGIDSTAKPRHWLSATRERMPEKKRNKRCSIFLIGEMTMISVFRKSILLAVPLTLAFLGSSARAQVVPGTLELVIAEDGVTVYDSTPVPGFLDAAGGISLAAPNPVTTPNYVIDFQSGQGVQLSARSEVLSSNLSITYTGPDLNPAGHQLEISITAIGYTTPVTPPDIVGLSHLGGTTAQGSSGDFITLTSSILGAVTYLNPPGFLPQSVGDAAPGSFKDDQSQTITGLAAIFGLQQIVTVQLDGNPGTPGSNPDTINYTSSLTLQNVAVPEPSSLVIAGVGGLGLVGYALRRRKALSV